MNNSIVYQTVYQYIDLLGMTVECALELAKNRKGKKNCNAKYYRNGYSLREYCLANKLKYHREWKEERKN